MQSSKVKIYKAGKTERKCVISSKFNSSVRPTMLIVFVISILFRVIGNASGQACSRNIKEWSTLTTNYKNVQHKGEMAVNTTCRFRDFIADGSKTIPCENGQLLEPLPICKRAEIASERSCSRRIKEWSTETTKYTNVEHLGRIFVFARCRSRDFIADGREIIPCENGQPTEPLPTCKKAKRACDPLDRPLFGSKLCSINAPAVQSICTFQCQLTHYLRGSEVRICAQDLQWTGIDVRCLLRPECPTPPPLENGKVIDCAPSKKLLYNNTCHFKCNEGFKLIGPDRLTCGLSGKMVDDGGIERFPKCYSSLDPCAAANCDHFCNAGRCSCSPGYRLMGDGRKCAVSTSRQSPGVILRNTYPRNNWKMTQLNQCQVNNGGCDQLCDLEGGIAKCKCKEGFLLQSDGKKCKEVERLDETSLNLESCNRQNGKCSHKCFQEPNGVRCACRGGYKLLPDNKGCTDIDECSFGNFGCSHRCVNTEGGAHCSCYKGYRLHNNRKQCEDINECFSRNFDCSHECVNTLGGAYCACRKGYKLHKDLKQCVDVDECSDDKLNRCDHDCLNFEGGYNCSCRPGYVSLGDFRCEPCRTNSYKSVNNLACVDCPAHSYTNGGGKTSIEDCFCNSGFSGNLADNVPCQDINECATENFGCSDICSNTLGSAHCACPPGFELQEDHKTCKDIDECSLKNGGCDGICHNTVGNFSCTCLKGYIASNRDRYSCDDVDECEEKNAGCSDTCINFQGGYHCACPEGYHLHPNGKNCVAVHCPRVYVPHHSLLKCKNGLTTNRVEYKPGQVPEDTEFPMGTLCRVKCSRGYELDTDPTIICENDGHWNATLPQCKVLQCPPLIPPVNGDVYPPSCKEGSTAVKEKCVFTCLPGYRITGQEVITCKNRLAWDFKKSTVCTPETNPYISCPDDVTTELPTNTSSVEMTLDSPRTNIKQVRISPEWVFVNRPTLFPAGETVVTFTVEDESGNKTNECSMSIFIVDKEPPEFYDCPETIHVIGSNTGTAVDWDEPVAFDNVGIATVFKSIEPNTTLTLGVHFVEYVARDIAGNAAECRFRINITSEGGCTDLADPENGEANCIDWIFGKICQPSCRLNYTRAEEEPEYFACDESGTWTPTSFISPCYPECSQDEFWSPELEECIGNYTVTTIT